MFQTWHGMGRYNLCATLKEPVISAQFVVRRYSLSSAEQLGLWVTILLDRPRRELPWN